MFISWLRNRDSTLYIFSGMLLDLKKDGNLDVCKNKNKDRVSFF